MVPLELRVNVHLEQPTEHYLHSLEATPDPSGQTHSLISEAVGFYKMTYPKIWQLKHSVLNCRRKFIKKFFTEEQVRQFDEQAKQVAFDKKVPSLHFNINS